MYENIFKRVEKKYLLNEEEYNLLFEKIINYIEKDFYYETTICNIYFDNEINELINTSIEKPLFKHKVRLRSYGIPTLDSDVFFEIKAKYKKIGSKRRIQLKLKDFYDYLNYNLYDQNNQIMKEIDYIFKLYNLKPSYFIAYDRKSYRGISSKDLRITIDTNLRSRTNDLSLELGDYGEYYFNEKFYIMEIKTLGSMPLWLVRILSNLDIRSRSFSKYGSIYKKNKESELC